MNHDRQQKAVQLLEQKSSIKRIDGVTYKVRSQSVRHRFYYVRIDDDNNYTCECTYFSFKAKECKHIIAVKALQNVGNEFKANLGNKRPKKCKRCGAVDQCIRDGTKKQKRGIKQRWYCKRCGYKFVVNDDGFDKVGSDPDMIGDALDLIFSGLSLRICARFLTRSYKLTKPLHNTTILKWRKKYIQLIKPFVDSIKPKLLEDIWHADEMMINVKTAKMGKGHYMWLWNMISSKTRFDIASIISKQREIGNARRLFAKGKLIAQTIPKEVITDGLQAYVDAFKKEFFTIAKPRPIHKRYPSLERNPNNNKIEAFHGQLRSVLKTRRGLGNEKSAQNFVDGMRIHRNFVDPHAGLEGKTPAEAAGIDLALGENKILELIKQSARARELRPEEKFKAALGKRIEYVDTIEEKECIKVKPRTWLGRKQWKEINNILRTFDFVWVSDRKDSLWIKTLYQNQDQISNLDRWLS